MQRQRDLLAVGDADADPTAQSRCRHTDTFADACTGADAADAHGHGRHTDTFAAAYLCSHACGWHL
jgi:hypothetical protein